MRSLTFALLQALIVGVRETKSGEDVKMNVLLSDSFCYLIENTLTILMGNTSRYRYKSEHISLRWPVKIKQHMIWK